MKKRLILLDIDDTLFKCDTFVSFSVRMIAKKPSKIFWLPFLAVLAVLFKFGIVTSVFLKENTLNLFTGITKSELLPIVRAFNAYLFKKKINMPVYENIKALSASGLYDIIVISASPAFFIDEIGRAIGAKATLATNVRFDENGILTAEIDGENCKGIEKIHRLKECVNIDEYDLENSYAFSDSITDLPMFELVGRPVAVTPDSRLLDHAVRNGYAITK